MTDEELTGLLMPLYLSFNNLAELEKRPLLAHYTSLGVLEKIMESGELWLSNPLFMNDLEEMRFGMVEGVKAFDQVAKEQQFIETCGTSENIIKISDCFHWHANQFEYNHAANVYVFCLSEHNNASDDGRLSMWRAYGGNGNGAAIIFNTDFITLKNGSPLYFAQVKYESAEGRIEWMKDTFRKCIRAIESNEITDDIIQRIALHMFNLMELYALTTKHKGFEEENEWRLIYLPERDIHKLLTERFSYIIGKNGIEPKLRFKIEPLKVDPPETWTFDSIVNKIILGPSVSSPIARKSVERMFEAHGRLNFKERLSVSKIPLRPAS